MDNNWFDRTTVQETLRNIILSDNFPESGPFKESQDPVISMLIHDIFGAEILKTHNNKGWHFYNRINGERIDLDETKLPYSVAENTFEDIPSSPCEASDYFAREDYSAFLTKFIREFEERVGLIKYVPAQKVNV
ncbi:MAG TPA: hypothetical protein VLQ76_01860 [Bacteroidales bacterium]|nr:hypothetical protein [Bacteroidales bacterium]